MFGKILNNFSASYTNFYQICIRTDKENLEAPSDLLSHVNLAISYIFSDIFVHIPRQFLQSWRLFRIGSDKESVEDWFDLSDVIWAVSCISVLVEMFGQISNINFEIWHSTKSCMKLQS